MIYELFFVVLELNSKCRGASCISSGRM